VSALTSEHLRELAEQALPTVLAHLLEGCAASLDGLPDRTDDVDRDLPVNGRPFGRRLVSTAPPRLQVIAGDDGITLRLDESISTVLWEQVVGLVNAGREQQLWYEACLACSSGGAGECVGEGVAGGHGAAADGGELATYQVHFCRKLPLHVAIDMAAFSTVDAAARHSVVFATGRIVPSVPNCHVCAAVPLHVYVQIF
jgi:hypothetical protein